MTQPQQQPNGWWPPPPSTGKGPPGVHYEGFGVFESPPAPRRRLRKKLWIIGGAAVAAAGCAATAWLILPLGGVVLDDSSVQRQVVHVLRTSYGERTASDARCPAGQPVEPGHTFTCTVTIDGVQKEVQIRVLNDNAVFTVGAPH